MKFSSELHVTEYFANKLGRFEGAFLGATASVSDADCAKMISESSPNEWWYLEVWAMCSRESGFLLSECYNFASAWRLDAGGLSVQPGNWRLEAARGWRLEARGWKLQAGGWRQEAKG